MSRVRYEDADHREPAWLEARIAKPARPPLGYTGNTVITEWLTVNCRGAWASRAGNKVVRVLFSDASDRDRAVAALGARADPTAG